MIEDTTPCSVENTEEDAAEEKKQHKKYDVATAKYNPFSVNNEQKSNTLYQIMTVFLLTFAS